MAEYAIGTILCLLLAGVWIGTAFMSREDTRDARNRAEAQARDLAEVLALEWLDTVHRVEFLQTLGRVTSIATLAGDPQQPEILQALRDATQSAGSSIIQVSGIDAKGDVIWSTTPLPAHEINLSGREHFQAIAQQGLDRFVGRPVVGAVSGQRTLQFAEAVRDSAGALRAVTVVSVGLEEVRTLASRLARVGGGVVTIQRSDGLILARSQETDQTFIKVNDFAAAVIANGTRSGLFKSRIDGITRFMAGQTIPSYGLVLYVALDADEQMRPSVVAIRQIERTAAALSFTLVLLALALGLGIRHRRDSKAARQLAAELEQSEALLRQIAETATDLISLHDAKFRFIYANLACQNLIGLTADRLIGVPLHVIASLQDMPSLQAELSSLSVDGGSRRVTIRINHAFGDIRWLESEIVPIEHPDGRVRGPARYIVISRDITQRVRDEKVLREVEQEFAALATLAPGRLYRISISPDGMRRTNFPGQGTLFDYPPNYLADSDFLASKMEPEDTIAREAAIRECQLAGDAVIEYRLRTETGDIRWVRDELRLTARDEAECVIVGYMSDVTAERDSKARARQIERLATLGEIASCIAHEVNQPLAIIAMASENAMRIGNRNGDLDPLIAKKLERIMDQAHRVGVVIDHIRLFGRNEVDMSAESDLADIVQNATLLVKHRLRSAGVELIVDLAADFPKLGVAAIPLEQVLVNLIVNACDAYNDAADAPQAPEQKRSIRISANALEAVAQIKVTDRAGGISPALIGRVFDPFFTTKPPGKGTGLGLSICLATIHEMGGTIDVYNENGGATFEIGLPRRLGRPAPRLTAPGRSDAVLVPMS